MNESTIILTEGVVNDQEEKQELSLRPLSLQDFIGQSTLKKSLSIMIKATLARQEPIDHLLFYGAPGLGKTSLAHVIANELGVKIKITSGPALKKAGDLASILTNLETNDILFIDEIHKLNRTIEEMLYPAMEDFAFDLVLGKGPSAKIMRLQLPHFSLVGATTRFGKISSPLRDRFGAHFHLDFYSEQEIVQIIQRSSEILGLTIDNVAIAQLAKRSRSTPRVANRLLRRVRDYAQVHNQPIDHATTLAALDLLVIDNKGLTKNDLELLKIIVNKFNGGPVGLSTLSAALGESIDTIEDVYEPFLIRLGMLERTPRGRAVTTHGRKYIEEL